MVTTYIPPFWIYNRAIVRDKLGVEFVIRRQRLNESMETSTVELIPCDFTKEYKPSIWDRVAIKISIKELLDNFSPTNKTMGITRAPL